MYSSRAPSIAAEAIASSLLVVLPMAETTTTGRRLARALTIDATRQLVGGLTHGRNADVRPAAGAGFDDRPSALDGGRRFHRRAAEFHDDHQSSIPSECISSAFSTAAPAAPRTVVDRKSVV